MLKLFKFLKPYSFLLALLLILTYGQTVATLALPDYTADIVNKGIIGSNQVYILHTGLKMIIISLLGGLATIGIGYLASIIGTGFAKDLRASVFNKVESFSLNEFNKFSTASLITRSTNDVQQVQQVYVLLFRLALMAPFLGIGAVVKAYNLAPSLTWIMAVAIAILVSIVAVIFTIAIPKFKILQKMVDKLNLVAREILTGLRVVRAFNNEAYESKKFDKVNKELLDLNLFVNRLMVFMRPAMTLVMSLTTISIVWFGAQYVQAGSIQIGDILAFMQYAIQGIMGFLMLSMIFIMVPRAAVSANRLAEVLETEPKIVDPKNPTKAKTSDGIIEFKNVTYAYENAQEPVLQDITFEAKPGQTTAIVGSTGSGKSTIVNLIPRFYDVTEGQILMDGVDVREYNQEDLYRKIGYVPQKSTLFTGTVIENIKYGAPKASLQDVKAAAKTAQAENFINELDLKFDNPISQGGSNVSGGQKQRLSIARAIARDPEIYLFDDSFSALDFATDAKLRQALALKTKHKTVIIVAQRISTVMDADKIVVLENGKIVGIGQHEDLLKTCKVYEEIALSQLSKEELLTGVSK